jgi:hypothetical protein
VNLLGVDKPQRPALSPNDLTELNLAVELARLGATEPAKPYPQPVIVGTGFVKDFPISGEDDEAVSTNNFYAEEKRVEFPDGVTPVRAWVTVRAGGSDPAISNVTVSVANWSRQFFTANLYSPGAPPESSRADIVESFDLDLRTAVDSGLLPLAGVAPPVVHNSLPVAVAVDNISALAVTTTLLCVPTPSAIAAWQREASAVLMAAYEARLQEWRDARTRGSFAPSADNTVTGADNPQANRKLERDELQRAIVEIIRNKPLDFHAIRESPASAAVEGAAAGASSIAEGDYLRAIIAPTIAYTVAALPSPFPTIDLDESARSGPEIRFLQQAFEWENMTYLFYPYFYGRPETWAQKVGTRSADPMFEEFLKAGAARVQIPVRPGFEDAVDHYLLTGQPWLGRGEPVIGDELWLAFFDERRATLGDRDDEVHHTERDFDVLVPTSLVKLRGDAALPRWRRTPDAGWREVTGDT